MFCRGPLPDEKQSAAELDAVLQHHHSIQEKLAEEMLHLARNLKNNTLVAQNVIKQDNQVWPVRSLCAPLQLWQIKGRNNQQYNTILKMYVSIVD